MSYTPTDKYIPCPFNGLIKEKYSKSYKFSISKPTTYPLVEDTVNGVVWIEDLELMDNSNIPDDRNTASNAAGRDIVTDPTGNTYFSLKNNFYVVAQLYSFPQKNAKNGSDLYDPWNDINSRDGVRYLVFESSKGFRVQEGELDKNSTADDLINLALKYLTFSYKSIVYGIKQYPQYIEAQKKFEAKEISLKEFEKVYDDIASLPENKMSLVIDGVLVNEVPNQAVITSPTQSSVPISQPTIIFNVERLNIFSSKELGDLKVITDEVDSTKTDDFILSDDSLSELDSEYSESAYSGPEEEVVVVDGVSMTLFSNAELRRDDSQPVDDGSGSGVNFGGSDVVSRSGSVSDSVVDLPADLKSVRNSIVITKQCMTNGFRPINTDITNPQGNKVSGSDITKNMNEFVSDVLGPFSTWLKGKYPSLHKGWYITSATRGYIPNGGSLTSQHMKGQAIDSQILGADATNPDKNIELCNAILEWYKSNPVGYGQILFETRNSSCWIHWSYTRGVKRLMFARFAQDSTKRSPANKTGSYVLPPLTRSSLAF